MKRCCAFHSLLGAFRTNAAHFATNLTFLGVATQQPLLHKFSSNTLSSLFVEAARTAVRRLNHERRFFSSSPNVALSPAASSSEDLRHKEIMSIASSLIESHNSSAKDYLADAPRRLPSPHLFARISAKYQLSDFMPILVALLNTFDRVHEAEHLLSSLKTRFLHDFTESVQLTLASAFIRAYLHLALQCHLRTPHSGRLYELKAREWYLSVSRQTAAPVDPETFFLLVDFCMNKNERAALLFYVKEFVDRFSTETLMQMASVRLQSSNFELLEEVLNDLRASRARISATLQDRLLLGDAAAIGDFIERLKNDQRLQQPPAASFPNAAVELCAINEQLSRSHGIEYIKRPLSLLAHNQTQLADAYHLQESLERSVFAAGIEKLNAEFHVMLRESGLRNLKTIKPLYAEWLVALSAAIENALKRSSKATDRSFYSVKLLLAPLKPDQIALITLLELFRRPAAASESTGAEFDGGRKVVSVTSSIANALHREIQTERNTHHGHFHNLHTKKRELLAKLAQIDIYDEGRRREVAALQRKITDIETAQHPLWTPPVKAEIGGFLLNIAVETLHFEHEGQKAPVFTHHVVLRARHERIGIVKLHAEIERRLATDCTLLLFDPASLPMLVPPRPWITYNSGGFLTHKNYCVKLKDDVTQLYLLQKNDASGTLTKILMGLDVLGSVAWEINEPVLHVMMRVWNEEMTIANFPPKYTEFEEAGAVEGTARRPSSFAAKPRRYTLLSAFHRQKQPLERFSCSSSSNKEIWLSRDAFQANHSQRCDLNYKLEIAKAFVGRTFYFPHHVDFRGRAYPIPPHFNHIGSDVCRGLLKFHTKKPLGANGLRWLKVHLCNLFGNNKISLQEREAFADANLQNIFDSADRPIDGARWWATAEDPWQTLATCMEIAAAVRSPNPHAYKCGVPVHVDGSCNGPQHYAALGRDTWGASNVNLLPADVPRDIYSEIAKIVAEDVAADVSSGESPQIRAIAAALDGKITRKIVKQPVMTNVYGVTNFGASRQILERLKEANAVEEGMLLRCSLYVARKVFGALDKLFVQARHIQAWLETTAAEIAASVPPAATAAVERKLRGEETAAIPTLPYPMTLVTWHTPLNFPAIQPYRKKHAISIRTALQIINVSAPSTSVSCDVSKQRAAFPPNFIHSLDATHMFMTALRCKKEGITYASVHDSFWTHACDIDRLNAYLREEFVALHAMPILERLRDEFVANYGRNVVPVVEKGRNISWRPIFIAPLPPTGDFDIEMVKHSTYFFS